MDAQPRDKNAEAAKELRAPIRDNDGQTVGTEDQGAHRNIQLAEAFKINPAEVGARKHPELAGAYAAVAAIEKEAKTDGLNAHQRAVVMTRVRQNVVNGIERGAIPEVKIKDRVEVKIESKEELEQSR